MSDDFTINEEHRREAARINLRKMLESKKRGDRITAAEVVEATGFPDWRSFGRTIHRFVREVGFVAFSVPNDGWRVGLPEDHIDFAEGRRRRAIRQEERGLDALVDAPKVEMNDAQTRRAEFLLVRSAARVQAARAHDHEIKREFKLDNERIPLLSATKENNE